MIFESLQKSQKSDLMPPKWSTLVVLGTSFGIIFLYVSQLPANSYFATGMMRNLLFYNFWPPILASEMNQQMMSFQTPVFDFILLNFHYCFLKSSKSSGRQNGTPNRPSGATLINNIDTGIPWERPPLAVMICWCILMSFWLTFGALLLPPGHMFHEFWRILAPRRSPFEGSPPDSANTFLNSGRPNSQLPPPSSQLQKP